MALRLKRRAVQLLSLVLLHSAVVGEAKWLCLPVLNCHSCALAWFACPIGVLVHYSGYRLFPFVALGTILVFGVLLGRLLCGWCCPFGFLQDLLHRIPSPKIELPPPLRWGKYAVLALLVFALPFWLGESTWFSFCRICPASALQVTIPSVLAGGGVTLATLTKLTVLVLILLLAVVSSRAFCRMLCPIGAMLALLNHVSVARVLVPTRACVSCGACDRTCSCRAEPSTRTRQGIQPSRSAECILCGECRRTCPRPNTGTSPAT